MTHPTLSRLAKNREHLLELVGDLPDRALDLRLEDGWSIRQTLTHLVNAEEDHRQVIEVIVAGDLDRLPDQVQLHEHNAARLAERGHLAHDTLLAALHEQREQTIALFTSLSADQLEKNGPHPVVGEMSVGNIFRLIAMHEHTHARDIQAILRNAGL